MQNPASEPEAGFLVQVSPPVRVTPQLRPRHAARFAAAPASSSVVQSCGTPLAPRAPPRPACSSDPRSTMFVCSSCLLRPLPAPIPVHAPARTFALLARPTRARMRDAPYRNANAGRIFEKSRRRDVSERSVAAQRRWRIVGRHVLVIAHADQPSLCNRDLSREHRRRRTQR